MQCRTSNAKYEARKTAVAMAWSAGWGEGSLTVSGNR
jgi:hypothetical protein